MGLYMKKLALLISFLLTFATFLHFTFAQVPVVQADVDACQQCLIDAEGLTQSADVCKDVCKCTDSGSGGLNLIGCYKLNQYKTVASAYSSPAVLINLLVKVLFILAGIIVFFMIIYSGFLFISGGVKGQEKARDVIIAAVGGLLVMFSAYWILQIIKIVTGADIGF